MAEVKDNDYGAVFDEIFSDGSTAGGIINARRPNSAETWDREGEDRRSAVYMADVVREGIEAIDIIAEGRRRPSK